MAVPKRRTSKTRRDKRRAYSYKFNKPTVGTCSNCGEPKLPHRVCRACGYYRDEQVLLSEVD